MLVITVIAWLSTRHLDMLPGSLQTTAEGIVAAIDEAISAVRAGAWAANHAFYCLPLAVSDHCNLVGLIPGLHSPTRDLSVTSALAVLVFFSVHWFGIKTRA